jgi:hypothetical protein
VLENIKAILEEAGTSFDHVVKRNVYLTHAGDFDTVYAIMGRYYSSPVQALASLPVSFRWVPASRSTLSPSSQSEALAGKGSFTGDRQPLRCHIPLHAPSSIRYAVLISSTRAEIA